jgi:hypothetical protein
MAPLISLAFGPILLLLQSDKNTDKPGSAIYGVLPAVLWWLLAVIVALILWPELTRLVQALALRLESGAAVKLGPIELDAIRVTAGDAHVGSEITVVEVDRDGPWTKSRDEVYATHRKLFLVHRLFPSSSPGQLYDILIQLTAHKTDIHGVAKVQYFFGDGWRNQVYESADSAKRFGILVSAYGAGFLALARIHLHSGDVIRTWRYIDFEMGPLGKGDPAPTRLD